jgi:hypothetical protein
VGGVGEIAPLTYVSIIGILAGIVSLLFWRYIASLEARLADSQEERGRDRDIMRDLRLQVGEAIKAVDKLADAIEAGNRLRDMEQRK